MDERGSPRVTVVVPAFDPGPWIEPAIASLLGQTLARSAYEVIFVDDGSTDGTPARLDALAAAEPDLVRVIHLSPSGAPGRPRNAGLAAARGEYVQFLDADDELALDGLERALAMAEANRSDVVVEKFSSASIARPQRLFGTTVASTTLDRLPELLDSSLGPNRLVRRTFIAEHGIVFPEGWRLMEDQAFAIRAYARASVVSILADAVCYRYLRRDDGGQLTNSPFDPVVDMGHLEQLWDLASSELPAGPALTRFRRRMYRSELLGRLGDEGFLALSPAERERFVAAAQAFAAGRVEDEVVAGLGLITRRRADLLGERRVDDLVELARATTDVGLRTAIDRVSWDEGRLEVRARAWFARSSEDRPLVVTRRDGRRWLDLGRPGGPAIAPFDVTGLLESQRADVFFRHPRTALEWGVKALAFSDLRSAPAGDGQVPSVRISALIDPAAPGSSGRPLDDGTWVVGVRLEKFGLVHDGPLGRAGGDRSSTDGDRERRLPPASLVGRPARAVHPTLDEADGLAVVVGPATDLVAAALTERRATALGDRPAIIVDVAAASAIAPLGANLIVRLPAGERSLPARAVPDRGVLRLEARPVGRDRLPPGTYPLSVRLDGRVGEIALGTIRAADDGRLTIGGLPRTGFAGRTMRAVARWADRAGSTGRRWGDLARRIRRRATTTVRRRLAGLVAVVDRASSGPPDGPARQ